MCLQIIPSNKHIEHTKPKLQNVYFLLYINISLNQDNFFFLILIIFSHSFFFFSPLLTLHLSSFPSFPTIISSLNLLSHPLSTTQLSKWKKERVAIFFFRPKCSIGSGCEKKKKYLFIYLLIYLFIYLFIHSFRLFTHNEEGSKREGVGFVEGYFY